MPIIRILLILLTCTSLSAAPVEVKDGIGQTLKMDLPASKIVSLAPHLTENLYAAGAGSMLVGAVSFSDYPEAAKEIPRTGSYNNINIELILSLEPDLVIAWKEGNQKQQIDRLKALGIAVYVDAPEYLEDIAQSLRNFGILTGRETSANRAAENYIDELYKLRKKYSKKQPLKIFYQAWNSPLITVNDQQFIGQIISMCGGENIFGQLRSLSPKVSVESVIRLDPDIIITSGMDEARPDWLEDWKRWSFMKAVQSNRLFFVPPDIIQRLTPRLLQGAATICSQLDDVREQMIQEK